MKQEIETAVQSACKKVFDIDAKVELTRPDEQFGDYATNIAMRLTRQTGKNPREIAEALAQELKNSSLVTTVSVAGPGFLNIRLTDNALAQGLQVEAEQVLKDKRVLLEYSCPNAFKELHTGHLYQTIAGDVLGRIFEASGAKVFRVNFGGDVGLHVAKCLYGIVQVLEGENPEKLSSVPEAARAEWISKAYVLGAKAYEDNVEAQAYINELNKQIYAFHADNDHESSLAQIYWTCREWSYDYFKKFYNTISVEPFDKYYPESQTTGPGLDVVRSHQEVFAESDGAVVYEGEKKGLHTRVFITSAGIPTYEAKDLGVIFSEIKDFPYDKRIIMTGNDQTEYMKVVFAALTDIDATLAVKQTHLTNGTVRFGDGKKMSSRLGNVTRAVDVLEVVGNATKALNEDPVLNKEITLGAVKYSFLKHRLGGDIAFDVSESVSLEGNSGPYLQYAHARACSILRKTAQASEGSYDTALEESERSLLRKMTEFTEVVTKSAQEHLPHLICTYLYELAQTFNRFYEKNKVIGSDRENVRLKLVSDYATILKNGLGLLGITAPEKM